MARLLRCPVRPNSASSITGATLPASAVARRVEGSPWRDAAVAACSPFPGTVTHVGSGVHHDGEGVGRPALRLLEPPPPDPDDEDGRLELARSMRSHPSSGRRRLLLHVSGDQTARIVFSRIARRWEHLRLLVVDGARTGLTLAVQRRPDLIVVDSRLRDADGEETVARLRHELRPHDVPIVVLGDDPSPAARARFVWAGASAYVTKPLDIAEVDRTVGELLEVASLR